MSINDQSCADCPCQSDPGRCIPGDIENILPIYAPRSASENSALLWLADHFRVRGDEMLEIVPKLRNDGLCVFFANGQCTVGDARPHGCRSVECPPAEREATNKAGTDAILRDRFDAKGYHQFAKLLKMFGLVAGEE